MASIFRVRTVMTGVAGSPFYSNLFFDATTVTPTQVTNGVTELWTDLLSSIATGLTIVVEAEVAVVDDSTGQITDTAFGTPSTQSSGGSGESLPTATQGLIRTRTGTYVNGREIRGRMFVPRPSESSNNFGAPNTTYVNALAGAAANLVDTGLDWVCWSRSSGQSAPIVSVSAWNQFAVLRSRRD